ncbi:helix-turn-helix transcriptional regulator [Pseudorhodobacter wandonensis]|uniref:helix-turn-helix transcriptional regulator n=1 Tax=Pseudorhodobacter wandonensis TaxID=1120568 RepID=UPI00067D899E|nr:helix-turn-helix transcriptional regulator [Pseudorhodobacter wandonensis]
MPLTGLTGSRVRERRLAAGIGQADLARAVGISASYLNLIEHNRRKISGALLGKLSNALGVEASVLAEGAEGAAAQDLLAAGNVGLASKPEMGKIDELLGRFPGWADLLAEQYRRIGHLERMVVALNDRISHDPHLSQALHEVLSAVSSVRSTSAILAETEDIEPEWRARFHANLHTDSERLAAGAEALVAYLDGSEQEADMGLAAPQEELESWLAAHDWHFEALEEGGGGPEALAAELAGLASGGARVLARQWVAQAAEDARRLPLAAFEAALLGSDGDDPLRLAHAFGCDVLTVFRRLAFRKGSKLGLVMCDGAGGLIMRKPVEGFSLPRHGTACPLWPLYSALSRPSQPILNVVEMPGLAPWHFMLRAYCAVDYPSGFAGPEVRDAAMLIEKMGSAEEVQREAAVPVGSTCRICPRKACVARREPSIIAETA